MKVSAVSWIALVFTAPATAQQLKDFERPDCSTYASAIKPESKCAREVRRTWRESNFAALQATGLMFNQMVRPDPEKSPEAKKAVEDEIEGSFRILFSVRTDGTVEDVRIVEVAGGVTPLAKLWADTIGQWTFAKVDKPVKDVEYRRIYLYSPEDDEASKRKSGASLE